jgi:hypothetical protein
LHSNLLYSLTRYLYFIVPYVVTKSISKLKLLGLGVSVSNIKYSMSLGG